MCSKQGTTATHSKESLLTGVIADDRTRRWLSVQATKRTGVARCQRANLLDAAAAQVYGGDGLALLLAQAPQQVVQRQPRKCALVRTWGRECQRMATLFLDLLPTPEKHTGWPPNA